MIGTYNRHLLVEMLLSAGVSLVVLSTVLLLANILKLTELVVYHRVEIKIVLTILACLLPYVFVYTLPMSTLMGTLLAFTRISGDNELTALKASGVSVYQMLPPVLSLSMAATVVTAVLSLWVQPLGHNVLKTMAKGLVTKRPEVRIKEKVFLGLARGIVIYVDRVERPGGRLWGVLINDTRLSSVHRIIIGRRGRIVTGTAGKAKALMVFQGVIQTLKTGQDKPTTVGFKVLSLPLTQRGRVLAATGRRKHPKEMSLGEMFKQADLAGPGKRRRHILVNLHQRFSLPIACLIMGLLGLPLGIQTRRGGRAGGVMAGLVVFIVYYLFMSSAYAFGKSGALPPEIGVWLPNAFFGVLGIYMIRKKARDRSPFIIQWGYGAALRLLNLLTNRRGESTPAP